MSYIFPTDLPISSPYGMRAGGFHPGVDFSDGVEGHPIHATANGVVIYNAYEDGGLGNTVTIQHDGIKSGYGHMRELSTVSGLITQGDVIGYVGNTGASTGPHLHFWMGQNPNVGSVDPMPYLSVSTHEDDFNMDDDKFRSLVYEAVSAKLDGFLFNGTHVPGAVPMGYTNWSEAFIGLVNGQREMFNRIKALEDK